MSSMTHRDRVLRTFSFASTDYPPYDLMEGCVWPELSSYFQVNYGLQNPASVIDYLDTDFRWAFVNYQGPPSSLNEEPVLNAVAYTKSTSSGPLSQVTTIKDVDSYPWPDPAWWQPADYGAFSQSWPDHARVLCIGWSPLFWGACEAFGMDEALVKMISQPKIFDTYVHKQHDYYMDILKRCVKAAQGHCDICWLGDDYASQGAMLMNPDLWRKRIKPYLAEQVRVARDHGMVVLFHSCGAVRAILPDMIDIGINALLVFQTTAVGMDAISIARDFGGKLAFYGGVDIQHLLSYGTFEETKSEVRLNIEAFEKCGGYIIANSHHSVATIQGRNIEAMCEAARGYHFQDQEPL